MSATLLASLLAMAGAVAVPVRPPLVPAPAPLLVDQGGYRYVVAGNHLLEPADVRSALKRGATPTEAIGALKRAYADRGYFLVAVVAQVQGREVKVNVVQGRLAHVEGPTDLAAYFAGLLGRDDVRHEQVVRRDLLVQAHAATEGLQAKLAFVPAAEPGASTLRIDTTRSAHEHHAGGSLSVGNLGNRYAGHDLAQVQGQLQYGGYTLQVNHARALTGVDADSRGAFYAATGATLTRVTPAGWFQLDGIGTRYRLGVAFAPLDPAGNVSVFGGGATQLLFADEARRWTLSEGLHRVHDRETVFAGAYALRDQRYQVVDLGTQASWQLGGVGGRPASLALALGSKLGGPGGAGGFYNGTGAPTADFHIFTARVSLDQALAKGYGLRLELSGQATPDTLPSYEQWVLGGVNALAAWLPGTLAGDRGFLERLTLEAPVWGIGTWRLRALAFAEQGASRYNEATGNPGRQTLTDAGASLALDLPGPDTHALLAYAHPLTSHIPWETRRRQRAHAFVYLEVGF
ncbi:ShlB/FhaC/HecB family hemolysin secretion/activation protein [Fulvimonas yonginensis]|uniref:ShlB/FhaC/HecB family hemolysin secretion/activation protein n=1 Tax=Fulvimonas yonginensis TaxID=1495200 RepID=A0ABU8JDQ6_9GAMM